MRQMRIGKQPLEGAILYLVFVVLVTISVLTVHLTLISNRKYVLSADRVTKLRIIVIQTITAVIIADRIGQVLSIII